MGTTGSNPKVPAGQSGHHLSFFPGPPLLRSGEVMKGGRQEEGHGKVPHMVDLEGWGERERKEMLKWNEMM